MVLLWWYYWNSLYIHVYCIVADYCHYYSYINVCDILCVCVISVYWLNCVILFNIQYLTSINERNGYTLMKHLSIENVMTMSVYSVMCNVSVLLCSRSKSLKWLMTIIQYLIFRTYYGYWPLCGSWLTVWLFIYWRRRSLPWKLAYCILFW